MAFALSMRPSTLRLLSAGRQCAVRHSRSVVAVRPYCQAGDRIGKKELKKELAEKTEVTEAQASRMLEAALAIIVEHVAAGRTVSIPGFGTFEKRHRAARNGRNPQTGAHLDIKEKDVPGFSAGSAFKQCVSQGSAASWKVPGNGATAPKATAPKATAPEATAPKATASTTKAAAKK